MLKATSYPFIFLTSNNWIEIMEHTYMCVCSCSRSMHAVMIFSVCWVLSSFKLYSRIIFGTKVFIVCVYHENCKTMKVMSFSFHFQLIKLNLLLLFDICMIINLIWQRLSVREWISGTKCVECYATEMVILGQLIMLNVMHEQHVNIIWNLLYEWFRNLYKIVMQSKHLNIKLPLVINSYTRKKNIKIWVSLNWGRKILI